MKGSMADLPRVWRPLNRPDFGVIDSISETIRQEEWKDPDLLIGIDRGREVILVSDYAGDSRESSFQSYSFLLIDLLFIWYWDAVRMHLRKNFLPDRRRLSYKKLQSDKSRARCLVPFLRAANSLPGVLITFLIHKRIGSLFEADPGGGCPPDVNRHHWQPNQFEKLMRVAHLSSLLLSGLVREGQRVLWVSDQDEMVPNDALHVEACRIFSHVLSQYLTCEPSRLQFATTRSDDGSLRLEDLSALPDFAAGCLAEITTSMSDTGLLAAPGILGPMGSGVSKKAHAIVGWLADNTHTLRKLNFAIDYVPPDGLKLKKLNLFLEQPLPEYDFGPDLEQYLRTGRI
jgi:hypothetical protein